MDQRKINKAIRKCVEQCEQTTAILAKIEEFLLGLKAKGGWRQAELREVEIGVRKVLYGILEGETYPGDATDRPPGDYTPDGFKSFKVNGA